MQKFNGSLVRQFPSLITGNAAAGVSVTVYTGTTGTNLATLYSGNGTGSLSNPLTTDSAGYYSFYAADGVYRLRFGVANIPDQLIQLVDVAGIRSEFDAISDEFDALEVSNEQFKTEQQAAYDAFVLAQGWTPIGAFADGFTFTQANQVGLDADGNWWRWSGTLPKTVTAGTLPTSDANYKLVGDGVLRSELAASDSTVLVGGVTAARLAKQAHILAVDYLPEGYVTDGSVDYTTQIQQAINDGAIQKRAVELPDFPVGMVVLTTFPGIGLVIPSNSVIFHRRNGQGELRLLPNANGNYRQVLISDVSNVYIPFIRIRGDKFTHTGTAGEFGHGLVIEGASNQIVIDEAELYDFWGDGLYIGQKSTSNPAHPDRLQFGTIFIDNARRNGFSLISASNLYIKHLIANNTRSDNSSTALPAGPHAGIDIEPNNGLAVLKNIQIDKVSGKNNQDGLFYVYLSTYAQDFTVTPGNVDITVGSVNDEGSLFAVRMAGLGNTGKVQGHITVNNVAALNTLSSAFVCQNWGCDVGLPVRIGTLSCANTGKGFGGNKFAAPVSVYQDAAGFGDIGNVTVDALSIQRDDIGVGAMAYATNAGGLCKNINVNLVHAQYGAVGTRYFGNGNNGLINWTLPKNSTLYVETRTASTTISTILNQGTININSTASPTITLPTIQAGMENAELEFYITSVLAHCDIQVSGGAIRSRDDSGTRYRIFAGDRVRLRARSGGIWNVVHVDGLFVKMA